jgi:hypothetical protein
VTTKIWTEHLAGDKLIATLQESCASCAWNSST